MGGVARAVVATGGGAVGGYSMLVFTGWDHGLQGGRAAKLKQSNLRYQLQVPSEVCQLCTNRLNFKPSFKIHSSVFLSQVDLEEERLKQKAASLTLGQTVALYALRVFLNLVVFALIGGTFFGIAQVTQFSQVQNSKLQKNTTKYRPFLTL